MRVGPSVDDTGKAEALPVPPVRGRVCSAGAIVSTPAEKAALFARTGAVAVDMEAAVVREAVGGVPVVSLRAILDDAGRTLPTWLASITDDLGRPRPLALAGRIVGHPSSVRELVRLARESKAALAALTGALAPLVKDLRGA
jgi:hypothetical protein